MKRYSFRALVICFAFLLAVAGSCVLAQQPPQQQQPANVAGNWTIYSKGARGVTATQTIQLEQNGTALTGHFKGPHQSGGLQGTINEQHIVFHTKTRDVLTFQGRVEGRRVDGVVQGNTIQGGFHDRQGPGTWQAERSN